VHDAVNLFVVVQNFHAKDGPAALGLHEAKSKVIHGMAVA
jgi:hypothetical protein